MDLGTQKAHYLRLYRKADEILKQPDNPCQIKVVDGGKISCSLTRAKGYEEVVGRTWCCARCKHLGPTGCTVESLSCKLGWCYSNEASIVDQPIDSHPTFDKIQEIRSEAKQLGLPMWHRRSFEENFPEFSWRMDA